MGTKKEIALIGFSCAYGNTEGEKRLAIGEFGFFSPKVRVKTNKLVASLKDRGKEVTLRIIIDDLEFRRAWGWTRSQEDLSEECQFMIDLAVEEGKQPKGAEIVLWSRLEPQALNLGCPTYEELLQSRLPKQDLLLMQDIDFRLTFPRHRGKRRSELEPNSLQRLAMYALEGRALELLYPAAILLQSESEEVDRLFQPLRSKPLPIINLWRKGENDA